MSIRKPGKSKTLPVLAGTLILAILASAPVLAKGDAAPAAAPAPATISPSDSEISFTGKVFCSLKRRVDLPFKGIITAILVHSGEPVEPGQVLARYRLAPEAVALIRQRLAPPHITDTEVRLAETERTLAPMQNKQQELTKLNQKKLAPAQSLEQANRELSLVGRERRVLQTRLGQDRQLAQDDLTVLQSQLGKGVRSGQIPAEVSVLAPIGGSLIWVHPDLQVGALLEPTLGIFQVGVMDPMTVRAQAFEIEALQIRLGETAEVTLESLPGRKFTGQVTRISWSSLTPGLEQPAYYDVELKLPNPELLLKDGLKAQIVFPKKTK